MYLLSEGNEIPNCLSSDIMFVLDASGSVNYSDWRNAKDLIKDIMVHMNRNNPAIRFGVTVFSSTATLVAELNNDVTHVSSRLTDVLWIGEYGYIFCIQFKCNIMLDIMVFICCYLEKIYLSKF